MNIILALITGICISLMIFFNGSLEGYVGNFPSLIFIHMSGFLLASTFFIKKGGVKVREKKSNWNLLAGVMGIVVVSLNNKVYGMGGVLLTLSGTLAGQVIMAAIMETVKHKKAGEHLPLGKILALCLVIPGATIIGLRSNLPFYWIIFSWFPGALIMVQANMNSQNVLSIGFRKTLIVHYGSTLLVLLIMAFFLPIGDSISKIFSGQVPLQFVIGGGTVAVFVVSGSSYLLLKLKPITYVLLLYSGQLFGAIFLDYTLGQPLSIEKIIAMILIVTGLFVGEIKIKKKDVSAEKLTL